MAFDSTLSPRTHNSSSTLCKRLVNLVTDIEALNHGATDLQSLTEAATWCACNGILMYRDPFDRINPYVAPISILPSKVPSHLFQYARELGRPFNDLIDAVSQCAIKKRYLLINLVKCIVRLYAANAICRWCVHETPPGVDAFASRAVSA